MTPEEVLERAAWLVKSQRDRVQLQEELQKVFQLDWNEDALVGAPDWVKVVKDPQPFNAMQWLVDVMAHDEPQYSVEIPEDAMPAPMPAMGASMMGGMGGMGVGMNADPQMQEMLGGAGGGMMPMMGKPPASPDAKEMGDLLENAVKEVFRQNDLRCPMTLQRDELYAAFVNGMIVDKVADLRLSSKWGAYSKRNRGVSPFYVRSINPAHTYFEYDEYGVSEVFCRYARPLKEIVRLYGGSKLGLANVRADDANGEVLFAEYWSEDVKAKWVERVSINASDESYIQATNEFPQAAYMLEAPSENPLGFIPYSVKIARGSSIFSRVNMVYPHLYAGHKSKLFLRQNLMLTVASTLAFMLVNQQWVQETDDPNNAIALDFSRPAVHGIRKGDKLTGLNAEINATFWKVMEMFGQKIEESTVSKVVAGASPGGVTAASGINLLISGGKLTVSGVQSALGEVRAGAVHKIFEYVRKYPEFAGEGESGVLEMYAGGAFRKFDPASFPERMNIEVTYNPFLPQDKALAMQTFLTPVLQGLLSSDYLYKQIGVNDVVTLRKQIEQDKDRALADQQFQQQVLPPEQAGGVTGGDNPSSQAEAQQAAAQPDQSLAEQQVGTPTPNPMESQSNPANALNDIFNSMQRPTGI